MDAMLIDLPQVSALINGGHAEACDLLALIEHKFPAAWKSETPYVSTSLGQVLTSLLKTGKINGPPQVAGPALQFLCHNIGERLNSSSFDDARMIANFATAALEGLPQSERLYGRVPPSLEDWGGRDIVVGYVTPAEADSMLEHWPEPDFDDPDPEIYAAREQIEGWLRSAHESQKTLIVFWV